MKKILEQYKVALDYHSSGKPGKIGITPTKPLTTQLDLALAYSPGVAGPCLAIADAQENIHKYTAKSNIVAVISNGTAVLGLGNLGAAASKPVMEGKAVLFKRFSDIDAIDLEVDTEDCTEFVNSIKYLSQSWGGINLEDIKAPECFIIEEQLKDILDIPVFHDDQHGTAIIIAAGLINAAHLTYREFSNMKIVVNGAGAAGIACIDLLKAIGIKSQNIILCDTRGVIYQGRKEGMNPWKEKHATNTSARTLEDALIGADVFLGLSVKDALSQKAVALMAKQPIIFAMANPDPEIRPELVTEITESAIIATGRSDYPNQINNLMGFPYIFRGALDVQANDINMEMKVAAANAIAKLARLPVPSEVRKAYGGKSMQYGREYIIPTPFDPRLMIEVTTAVAKAAIDSGVARKKSFNLDQYKLQLQKRSDPASFHMHSIFSKITDTKRRIIFTEGEEEEVIKAALVIKDQNYGMPILIGRKEKIISVLNKIGDGVNFEGIEMVTPEEKDIVNSYKSILYEKLQRQGYLEQDCVKLLKQDKNIFAACMLEKNEGDVLIAGSKNIHLSCINNIKKILRQKETKVLFGYSIAIHENHNFLIADCIINESPNPSELASMAVQAAEIAKNIGYKPKVAFLSSSTYGNPCNQKEYVVTDAIKILDSMNLDFEYDGAMSPEIALNSKLKDLYPFSKLSGPANILIMPSLDAATIATKLVQQLCGGTFIGPLLTGFSKPVQVMQITSDVKEIVNATAFAISESLEK